MLGWVGGDMGIKKIERDVPDIHTPDLKASGDVHIGQID
jgi:hypothetical protein